MSKPHTSIQASWDENAQEWIRIITEERIGSRAITNPAIIQTVLDYQPKKTIDIGCGEGWLCRHLAKAGLAIAGADGTAALIDHAKQESSLNFQHITYENIIDGQLLSNGPFEAAVFNFCLYQEQATLDLLLAVHQQLQQRSLLIIQTIHPAAFVGSGLFYQSQWLEDSWKGLEGSFSSTHRWYFRTFSAWVDLFNRGQFQIQEIREPRAEHSDRPASIIFVLSKRAS